MTACVDQPQPALLKERRLEGGKVCQNAWPSRCKE
jgi:hypothetical protein